MRLQLHNCVKILFLFIYIFLFLFSQTNLCVHNSMCVYTYRPVYCTVNKRMYHVLSILNEAFESDTQVGGGLFAKGGG